MQARGASRAFAVAHDALRADGVLLIQDFLRPSPKPVELGFRNEGTRERFFRFAGEFRPRRIQYRPAEGGVRLDITDAVEFVSKYRSPTEDDWQEEMGETHFALTEEDFTRIAESAGFRLDASLFLPKSSDWLADVREDLDLVFAPEYGWIHLAFARWSA